MVWLCFLMLLWRPYVLNGCFIRSLSSSVCYSESLDFIEMIMRELLRLKKIEQRRNMLSI